MSETYGVQPGSLKEALSSSTCHLWEGKGLRLQVTNSKVINEQSATERRYRCVISDGKYSIQGLIDARCNAYLEANGFARYSIITVKQYTVARTLKRIVLISDLLVDVPRTERISSDLTSLDTYFDQHPDEDTATSVTGNQGNLLSNSPQPQPPQQQQQQQQQQPQKPNQQTRGRGPERPVNPIESLSPYQNNWTIKGRISYKGEIRTWSNSRGEGKLFNVNFLDESDEIRATAFNDMADKFYNLLEEGKVYYVTKARIQQAKPKFSHLSHPYELSLDKDTEITECFDTSDVPKINFNFTKLNDIQNSEKDAILDVVGVIKNVNDVFQITAKSTGKPFNRRNITLVDDSNFAIDVGLWNATAVDFSIPAGSVVAIKGVKVQDFGGRSLSLTQAGSIMGNPDIPEAYQLKGWYDNKGVNENFQSMKTESAGADPLANRKTIQEAEQAELGTGEKPDYFSIKGTINYFKTDNFCYPACNNEVNVSSRGPTPCNRKVIQESDGSWRCERCNLTYAEPHYRYILNCSLMDHTGQIWATLFDNEAKTLFQVSANELLQMKELENSDVHDFSKLIYSITMKEFNFRLRAKQESFNGNMRVRYNVVQINEIDFNAEGLHLAKQLESVL
ncbi:hypothetical protein C7M61_001244 [Candidozyma pseudohaemuli]|uniref:Replication protein A subunit n=1 Tax=Candidozyma pseudohaemuli TaxID=418784 RepID=A0A2P7Z019_9ASCO|nr:hypothetical protein C7M61_001244 [[Candida] pseudohaemulonii]PSK41559.1 hypothetical protein C7M61_001244 [[Candida] pseudohaemulonii]